jgi:hypothetical protein
MALGTNGLSNDAHLCVRPILARQPSQAVESLLSSPGGGGGPPLSYWLTGGGTYTYSLIYTTNGASG